MVVFIRDLQSEKRYCFDPVTGEKTAISCAYDKRFVGYGAEVEVGFFKKKRVFSAVFPYDDALLLWINGHQFNLRDKDISIKRRSLPFTWTHYFSVKNRAKVVLSFWYSFLDLNYDGDWVGERDILAYVSDVIAPSRKAVEKTFFIMNAQLSGRTLGDPYLEKDAEDFLSGQDSS